MLPNSSSAHATKSGARTTQFVARQKCLLRPHRFYAKHIPVRKNRWNGVVAQLVERLVRNEKVRGSTPLGSTILRSEPRKR